MNKNTHTQTSNMLLKTVNWLCRPLVKLLIKKGITFPTFSEILKSLYIDVAHSELKVEQTNPSLSRIFIKTGINRKEIKRLLPQILSTSEPESRSASLGALLVARWTGAKEYLDHNGSPKKLARVSSGSTPGFNDLVASVSKDIHHRALLDEWLQLGIVTLNEQDQVCLNEKSFIPKNDTDEKMYFFAKNLHDHIESCCHNIITDKPAMFERSVFYSSLSQESIQRIKSIAVEHALDVLNIINKEANQLKSLDKSKAQSIYRFRFGCYWYDTKNSSEKNNEHE